MVKIAGDDTTILDMKRGRLWDIAMRVVAYLKDHGGSARLAAVTFAIGLRRGATNTRIRKTVGKNWGVGRVHPFYKLFEDFFELEDRAGGGVVHLKAAAAGPLAQGAPKSRIRGKRPPLPYP